MFYVPSYSAHFDRAIAGIVREETVDRRWWAVSGFIPGGMIPLSEIRIGETCYRLREPLRGQFLPADDGTCEFWVDGFSPTFAGKGAHTMEAYRDWRDKVHETFQDLYGKRPFEMTDEEQARWQVLEDVVDVVGYRNETPIVIRQIGRLTRARLPRKIEWIDGKTEVVNLDDMPGEFACYKPGQPFEADVERDPLTWRIRKVRFIRRIKTIHPMAGGELQSFWQSMPATTSLPASDRNWIES